MRMFPPVPTGVSMGIPVHNPHPQMSSPMDVDAGGCRSGFLLQVPASIAYNMVLAVIFAGCLFSYVIVG